MVSNFGNIFVSKPRQAESTDTRLGIRRHDPEQEGRRRKDGEQKESAGFETGDHAVVTVSALRIFLENFLASLEPQKKDGGQNIGLKISQAPIENSESAPAPGTRTDGEAAKAASVYQHVAQKVDRTAPPATTPPADDSPAPPELAAGDVRTIHQLLADLGPLAERGVEYLVIEHSDSFLNSLVTAIAKAKNS